MIRVKLRYENQDIKPKLLRFDESIEFPLLLQKIVGKLGIQHDADSALSECFELTLGGDHVIEDTSEIDDGDDLVLQRKGETDDVKPEVAPSQSSVKEEEEAKGGKVKVEQDDEDEDEDAVEDVTETMRIKKSTVKEAITLSSDSESEGSGDDDEDDDGGDDDGDGTVEEGSDAWEEPKEKAEESEDDDSDGSDYDEENTRKRKRRQTVPESPLQVTMNEKDVPTAPGRPAEHEESQASSGMEEVSTLVGKAGKGKADQAIKDRIIKLLNTGFHDKSNEHEAKNAMKLAQRLMTKHNLSQALLLKERDAKNKGQEDEILKGGMVHVEILNRKTQKPAQFARWISNLSVAVSKNFGVDTYHSVRRGRKCSVTFYGIYTNAQLAGYAFRVATERIAQMTAEFQPRGSRLASTKSCKLSYSVGIVQGISNEVDRNIQMEKERRERKLERAKNAVSKGEVYEESDDEVDDDEVDHDNDGAGFDIGGSPGKYGASAHMSTATGQVDAEEKPSSQGEAKAASDVGDESFQEDEEGCHKAKAKPSISGANLQGRLEQLEQEKQAAIVLVDHSKKIAQDVLKENGIKLSKGRRKKNFQFDSTSYGQGIEDSKQIDINQRAIRDEIRVKKEENDAKKRRKRKK